MDLGGDVSTAAAQWRNVTRETIFFDLNLKLRCTFLRIYNFFTLTETLFVVAIIKVVCFQE